MLACEDTHGPKSFHSLALGLRRGEPIIRSEYYKSLPTSSEVNPLVSISPVTASNLCYSVLTKQQLYEQPNYSNAARLVQY